MPSPKAPDRDNDVDPLTKLAIKYGTDKWGPHFYSPIYHSLFAHLRDQPVRLLEIGVGGFGFKTVGGASLAMWAEYFPRGRIVGIDIVEKDLALGPRITLLQGSQDDAAFLARVGAEHGPFDIIIDDGSHVPAHVVASFDALFAHLSDNGIYVIEDVQTSFWPRYGGSVLHGGATMRLARSILDYLNHAEIAVADPAWAAPAIATQIRALRAYHNMLVIEKGDNAEPSNAAYRLDSARSARALETIESELERAPTPEGIANLVEVYSLGGRHAKAQTLADDALAKWPDNPTLLSAGLGAAHRRGDVQQRLRHIEHLLRLEPDNAPLRAELDKARADALPASRELGEPAAPDADLVELLRRATDHHKQGRLSEAQSLYADVLAADPENFDALNRLGILKYQQGQLDAAQGLLVAAIARNPHSDVALSNYASVLLALKRFEEALENCDRALALKPDEPDVIYNRGHVLMELKRYEEALASYDRVLAIRPSDPQAMRARGKTLLLLNRPEDALACYESDLTLNRNDADAWYNHASALIVLERFDDALASCRRALAIRPDHEATHIKLGGALLALGRSEEALACYESVLSGKPDNVEALTNQGVALLHLRRYEDALASFERALATTPNNPVALFGRGNALLGLERLPEALASFDQLLTINPQHAGTLRKRGEVLFQSKRFDEALASYDQILAADPTDVGSLNNRALVLLELKRPQEALADFDRTLAIKPADADGWYNSGNAAAALTQFDDALARYDRALAIDPRHALSLINRGNALRKLNRLQDALASYDAALAIKPDLIDALGNRAGVLAALGRQPDALASYERILAIEPGHFPTRWTMVMNTIPGIALSKEEQDNARKAFDAGLDDLSHHLPDGPVAEKAVYQALPFYLAYQEENNRELFARYGELCARATGQARSKKLLGRPTRSPLRVGIVSAHVRKHSVWDALLKGILQHIDPNRIEVDVFHLGALTDAETAWASSRAAHFEQGPHEPQAWVDRILARQPDVLLYPEIGMEHTIIHLASQRLAGLQATMWGHPHTTGLPTVDYFFSADALEPPDAEDHYTEKLIRLPRLGCCIAPSEIDAAAVDALGVRRDAPLLLSSGTPYKYAPQHDWVFAEIAKRLGRCSIVFFRDMSAPWSDLYRRLFDRMSAAFAAHGLNFSDHCVVLPWQERAAYYSLMKRADIMLDTIGFSGFNTAMQAVECGLPIVAREGRFMRGRLASGILRSIGLEELIAADEARYVDLAVAMASDKDRRDAVRRRIELGRDRLFNDTGTVQAFQERLLELARR